MRYLATCVTTLLILIAVALPGSRIPNVEIVGIDKLAHFTLFMLWSLAIRRDFGVSFRWLACLAAGLAFSWLTEILQIVVDGRTFDYTDIVADSAGLVFGLLSGKFWLRLIGKWI